ncbi:MAG: dehydrogenase, partial [Pseudomonadota bacterium]
MTNPSKTAQALWVIEAGKADLRALPVSVGDGEVFVKTLYSGISRGTERLVFNGHVPESEHETMRAPFQEGTFHYPVKYGYSAVGVVEGGARDGERVFALFPHQSEFSIPTDMALTIPNNVPTRRAILAANMETALNIVWDAGVGPGDRVVVVGCGVVGALAGYLAAQIIGTEVTLVDLDEERAELAAFLGCAFCTPAATFGDADVVV